MYIVELMGGQWICSENKKNIEKITGKAMLDESMTKIQNLWYQPFNYQSGVMSDFFWVIKDGVVLDEDIPMREWQNNLPLSECVKGDVEYLGKRPPKWYRDLVGQSK